MPPKVLTKAPFSTDCKIGQRAIWFQYGHQIGTRRPVGKFEVEVLGFTKTKVKILVLETGEIKMVATENLQPI